MARVSVVVSTMGNAKDSLLQALKAVVGQSYRDWELLVADDGSTDDTGPACLRELGPDPARADRVWRDSLREETGTRSIQMLRDGRQVFYLHHIAPRGPSASRNRAIALASGELLAFCSCGDLWFPEKLARQVELLDEHPEYAACCDDQPARKTRKKPSRKGPSLSDLRFEELLEGRGVRLGGAIVRRTCLGPESPFDENLPVCEDYDFWLRMGSRHALARLSDPLQQASPPPAPPEWGLERFRVYALEKAYQGGHLGPTLRHRVAEELVRQCTQLVDGYRDRDNQERANFYDRKRKRFAQEVAKLDLSDPMFNRLERAGVR